MEKKKNTDEVIKMNLVVEITTFTQRRLSFFNIAIINFGIHLCCTRWIPTCSRWIISSGQRVWWMSQIIISLYFLPETNTLHHLPKPSSNPKCSFISSPILCFHTKSFQLKLSCFNFKEKIKEEEEEENQNWTYNKWAVNSINLKCKNNWTSCG